MLLSKFVNFQNLVKKWKISTNWAKKREKTGKISRKNRIHGLRQEHAPFGKLKAGSEQHRIAPI
jgi:hypothetical protein